MTANVVDTDLHEALAKAVLRNQDKLHCILSSDQLANIVVSVENTEFLEECKLFIYDCKLYKKTVVKMQ